LPLLVVVLGAAARRWRGVRARALSDALEARGTPLAIGALTALFLAWAWGSLSEPAFIHDEQAYLLQAAIFAGGQLSGPTPPLPEFFEQYHVLLTPRLAPKYPPGHALLLAPGLWLGLPGLMPVLLLGLAGGLTYAIVRRLAGGWVALLAWLFWLSAPMGTVWRCTYLSESTSTAVFLLCAFLLVRFTEQRRTRDLVGIALLTGLMVLARPLTAVALAVPIGVVVLLEVRRARLGLRALLAAGAAGAAVLAVLPLWSAASTGDVGAMPYTEYSRVYFPYEKLGFGLDPAPRLRELPPDMATFDLDYRRIHAAYTPGIVPQALLWRMVGAGRELWGGSPWRPPLLVFFVLGLLALDRRGRFALAWVLALFLVYLTYAHVPYWAVYYHEAYPILAYVTALGLARALQRLAGDTAVFRGDGVPALPAAVLAALGVGLGLADTLEVRPQLQQRVAYHRAFARVVSSIPDERALVFVRYHPAHNPHRSLIENPPDHARARVWIARDRGADNRRLQEQAPGRAAYLFDEASFTLVPLAPP
jgi:hypothetical protein